MRARGTRSARLCLTGILAGIFLAAGGAARAAVPADGPDPAVPGAVLRICSDPNNLPYSDANGAGFEDRIAAVLAADLHVRVVTAWGMQRLGFLRRTLQAHACDVVMGITAGIQGTITTRPYYRSSYEFVSLRSRHLSFTSFDDPALRHERIGLHAIGANGANPPPAMAMAKRGMGANVVGFPMYADRDVASPSGRIIDAVAHGDIDAAAVWGPFAGYFGKPYGDRIALAPIPDDAALPGLPFAYDIAIGVRTHDTALRDALDAALAREHAAIGAVLAEFHVPLVPAPTQPGQGISPAKKKEI